MTASNQPNSLNGMIPLSAARVRLGLPVTIATLNRWARDSTIPATRIGCRWFVVPDQLRAAVVHEAKT